MCFIVNKSEVITELEEIIRQLKLDERIEIEGIKIMVCVPKWKHIRDANSTNLFIDWKK